MIWLTLTIPKGKRKKRAHKKWLKNNPDINAWLRATEDSMAAIINDSDMQEKLDKYSYEMLMYGRSTVEFPDGTQKEYSMIPAFPEEAYGDSTNNKT